MPSLAREIVAVTSRFENAISATEAIRIARVNMITLKNWCKTGKFIVWKVGGRYWIDPEKLPCVDR